MTESEMKARIEYLEGLVVEVERRGSNPFTSVLGVCPWCGERIAWGSHEKTCPAFSSKGRVRGAQ